MIPFIEQNTLLVFIILNEFHGNHAIKSTSVVVNGNDELLVPLDPNIYWDAPTEFIFHDLGMCYN